jgi:hypothetical protein
MWCKVRSTWCEARGTRCKPLCLIIQQNELVPEICLYEVEGDEHEAQSTRYKVRDTRCEVRGTKCEVRGTGYVRGMWYEIQGMWCRVHGTGHSRTQMNNKDIIFVHIMAYRRLDWNPPARGVAGGGCKISPEVIFTNNNNNQKAE